MYTQNTTKEFSKKATYKDISEIISYLSTAVSNFCYDIRRIAMTRIDHKLFILNNYKFSMHGYFLSNCRSNKYENVIYLEFCSAALTIGHGGASRRHIFINYSTYPVLAYLFLLVAMKLPKREPRFSSIEQNISMT